jgi:hypothetical protein
VLVNPHVPAVIVNLTRIYLLTSFGGTTEATVASSSQCDSSISHSDLPIANAITEVADAGTGNAVVAMSSPSAITPTQLASIFQVSEEKITKMRKERQPVRPQ